MDRLNLSFLEKKDIPEAARVLSKAMLDVPLHTALFQGNGEKQRKIIENMFFELLTDLPGITFVARMGGPIVAVMRMKSCEGSKATDEKAESGDADDLKWRVSVWRNEWARHDPSKPHWHLGPVGVLPQHQSKGIGSELLGRFCREVDACMSPAYLETDTDSNVRFYERFGFAVAAESDIFGVQNRYMWRPAVS